jgi:macrodomain Ter protein organizer (MatP/YcbG family)
MNDTFWITLPVDTWRRLFRMALDADRTASDYLRVLIEKAANENKEGKSIKTIKA